MNTRRFFTKAYGSLFGLQPKYLLCLLLCFLSFSAHADIWGYVDPAGVAHFSPERVDERYEIYFRNGAVADVAPDPKADDDAARALAHATAASKVQVFFDISPSYRVVKHHLRKAASTHSLDYELLKALIATESGFDALAVSPKGAIGLMQLMPATAERFGVVGNAKAPLAKSLTDPGVNINAGSRYLRYLINLFPGQLELALAAYNAGEGAVQRAGNQIPNFKETQNYVRTVMQLYTLLKPPAAMLRKREAPARVHMQFQGGALNRGNMIPSGSPQTLTLPNKIEID